MPIIQHFAVDVWEPQGQLPNFKAFFFPATRDCDVQHLTRKAGMKSRVGDCTGWRETIIGWATKFYPRVCLVEWATAS